MAVRGALLDLEGVLYQADAPIALAREALDRLGTDGIALRYLTNTTTKPRGDVVGRMHAMGFALDLDEVFSPAMAAVAVLRREGLTRVHLAAPERLAEDFAGFDLVDDRVEAVVMGDLYTGYSWQRLNRLFQMVLDGAAILALHKNRYCRRDEGLSLDLGPFVAALEYAAGTTARVLGKPDRAFFDMALASIGLAAGEVVMIGDDIEADIGGAQSAGLRAVQVETGKYSARDRDHPSITPDARIATIADLPDLLARMG